MGERGARPAFYAARPGRWRDWWTILHPPYTAWHLAYVVIGASLAPHVDAGRLIATVMAFFAAVGVSAHALDELQGRPLRTGIPTAALVAATVTGLVVAVSLGVVGVVRVGVILVPFIIAGPVLVYAYNAEVFGGVVHTDAGFALAWGAFPVLTAYAAQAQRLAPAALLGAAGAFALSYAQRRLSTPARLLRRQVRAVSGALEMADGTVRPIDAAMLREPLEHALQAISVGLVALAAGMAAARLG